MEYAYTDMQSDDVLRHLQNGSGLMFWVLDQDLRIGLASLSAVDALGIHDGDTAPDAMRECAARAFASGGAAECALLIGKATYRLRLVPFGAWPNFPARTHWDG